MKQLQSLLTPGEFVWLFAQGCPRIPELSFEEDLKCLQMVLPEEISPPQPEIKIVRLSDENAQEMVALTDLAFPGFFRQRTCEMGSYYGVRAGGELIALGGERLKLSGYTEISAVCTHPEHRGKGLAANLIRYLARKHRREAVVSCLHVGSDNHNAIELYLRLSFRVVREVTVSRIRLPE